MVLGVFDASRLNFAFMMSCPPTVTVVSSPLQTRLESASISFGTSWPSPDPETIDHEPCSLAISVLAGESSAADAEKMARAASPRNIIFIVVLSWLTNNAERDRKRESFPAQQDVIVLLAWDFGFMMHL